jgi:hypothetical protein
MELNRFSGGVYGGKTLLAERAWTLAAFAGEVCAKRSEVPHFEKGLPFSNIKGLPE